MSSDIDRFFASAYNLTPDQYGLLVKKSDSNELFTELYGHAIGFDDGALPLYQRSSYYESQGVECLPNKLISYQEHSGSLVYKDKIHDYIFNSDGFRSSRDYDGSEELVFAGCSQTLGEGSPENAIWGSQVARSLEMSYANISRSGASAYWIVDAIFGYLKKYKAKPKVILALMPDFHRVFMVSNPLISIPYLSKNDDTNFVSSNNQWIWGNYSEVPKYLEKPFPMESSISRETAFMLNLRAIHSLESYCEVAGIKFIWGTWAPDEETLFSNTKKLRPGVLDHYANLEACNWHSTVEDNYSDIYHGESGGFGTNWSSYGDCKTKSECKKISCHRELEEEYGSNFYLGTDWPDERLNAHFGVHRHTHLAEGFLKAIEDYENIRD